MKTVLLYLLQVIISSGILYGYYHFFLRNKKFHQYNRYYLLMATFVSICIPFLHIPVYFDSTGTQPIFIKTLTVFSAEGFEQDVITGKAYAEKSLFTWKNILSSVYLIMAFVLFIRLCIAFIRIGRLVRVYPGDKVNNIRFFNTTEPATPFSFFNWLFWNSKIEINSDHGQQIFRHELYHIRQKHSWDIIFMEIVTILFWLNPFSHLIKKEITAIHEFLADKFAVEENKEWDYAELLLMQVLGSPNTRLTNPFFHNQIKRRIAMLTTSKKPGAQYLRKIMVLPLAVIIIGLFAFTYKNKVNRQVTLTDDRITIVVDASHGGTDPGAKSPDDKYAEADLSLAIARQIKELATDYNINVVMTRDNNEFPGGASTKDEALRNRVNITNKIKPVAFISIHLNTASPIDGYTQQSGIEAYVSNNRNDNGGKQLASAILQNLSGIYKTRQELKYRSQPGVWVLDQNSCPSVLLECGFINSAEDLAFITDKANQEKIARKILEAIVQFRSKNAEISTTAFTDTVPPKISKKSVYYDKTGPVILQADSIIWKSDPAETTTNYQKALLIVNGKKTNYEAVKDKTIIAKTLTFYNKNDEKAIALYGEAAKGGVIVFEEAAFVNIKMKDYYKAELNDITNNKDDKVFEKVEIEAAFKGGMAAWKKFLAANLNAVIPVDKGAPAGKYTVLVQFIVNKEGKVSDIVPLTKHGYGMEDEVVRVVANGPEWLPAIQNGKTVKAYRKQPVTFSIEEEKKLAIVKEPAAINPNNEVVVVGYPAKSNTENTSSGKEVVVQGYSSKESAAKKSSNKEVVVKGYPINKGQQNATHGNEIIVNGYPTKEKQPAPVFEKVEYEPSFPGGNLAWSKYLERNSNASVPVDNGAPAGVYKVELLYIVKTDGSLSDIKALTSHGYGMEEEAIRLIKNSPHWIPAMQNGKKVNAYRKQPITFQIEEDNTTPATTNPTPVTKTN